MLVIFPSVPKFDTFLAGNPQLTQLNRLKVSTWSASRRVPNGMERNTDRFIDFEPGLVGVPVGFLLGFIGTITSPERNDAGFAEMRVRSLTGAVIPARTPQLRGTRGTTVERDRDSRESRTLSEAR